MSKVALKATSGLNPAIFGTTIGNGSDYKGTGVPATIPNCFFVFFYTFFVLETTNEDK